jgi:hypothetical protein
MSRIATPPSSTIARSSSSDAFAGRAPSRATLIDVVRDREPLTLELTMEHALADHGLAVDEQPGRGQRMLGSEV